MLFRGNSYSILNFARNIRFVEKGWAMKEALTLLLNIYLIITISMFIHWKNQKYKEKRYYYDKRRIRKVRTGTANHDE